MPVVNTILRLMISDRFKKRFFKAGLQKKALVIALVVGTLLNCINQGPEVMSGGELNWFKLILTYTVPYFVSVYSAATSDEK